MAELSPDDRRELIRVVRDNIDDDLAVIESLKTKHEELGAFPALVYHMRRIHECVMANIQIYHEAISSGSPVPQNILRCCCVVGRSIQQLERGEDANAGHESMLSAVTEIRSALHLE